MPINYSHNNIYSNKSRCNLHFGCRMMAFINSKNPSQEDQDVRTDLLEDNQHSLKQQSKKGVCLEKSLNSSGNPDGWGIISYQEENNTPNIIKSPKPAYLDFDYIKTVKNFNNGKILMAHIRKATAGEASDKNSHPFTYKNWCFEHNGKVAAALSPEFQENINGKYSQILNDKPKGKTDSESMFYYFLGRMKETYGTTNTKEIGIDKVKNIFAKSMTELVKDKSASCNVILSDGENIFALRKGHSLYLGEYTNKNKEKQYILSSETTDTLKAGNAVKWQEIPEENVLVISKNKKGELKPVLNALTELV